MNPPTSLYRIIGAALVIIGALLGGILYFRAPWSIDMMDFLVRPLLLFVLPISIVGLLLATYRGIAFPKPLYPLVVMGIGIVGVIALYDWPSINSQYFWEDSNQQLFVLETAYFYLSIPFLYCCWMSISSLLLKKPADK
ncbi:MAG: hypothetical protein HGA45_24825 [Chloroflexales bacterium]|nr:hypothetical protein [Chloroflexales bacterium]